MASQKLTIYVAYCVKDGFHVKQFDAEDLESYMSQAFVGVRLKQRWTTLPRSRNEDIGIEKDVLDFVEVADHDGSYHKLDGQILPVSGAKIHVDVFMLSTQKEKLTEYIDLKGEAAPDDAAEQSRTKATMALVYTLPNKEFAWQWNSLIFDDFFKYRTLRYLLRRVFKPTTELTHEFQSPPGQIILVRGPTGTGKTRLCEALAQQMSIRLSSYYSTSKLIRVNAPSFVSKWSSENDKAVTRLFSCIEAMVNDDQYCFIIVLIDNIEVLARSRKSSTGNAESSEVLRTTNALLTGLDTLRNCPSVLLLSTTNTPETLDDAFLDRVSNVFVSPPGAPAHYEMLRAAIVQMVDTGSIRLQPIAEEDGEEVMLLDDGPQEPPNIDTILLHYREISLVANIPEATHLLYSFAKECEGMSGRKLANIPSDAICYRTQNDVCTMEEALDMIRIEIDSLHEQSSS